MDLMYNLREEDRISNKLIDLVLQSYIEIKEKKCIIIIGIEKFDYMNNDNMDKLYNLLDTYTKIERNIFFDILADTIEKSGWGMWI